MRDGLYKVFFATPLGAGAGVVHLMGGRLWGGDAGLFYIGKYQVAGEKLDAEVVTNRHTQIPGLVSVFGIDRVHIRLKGEVRNDTIQAIGTAVEAPGIQFRAELSRIAD